MNVVILEIKGTKAVALTEEGQFLILDARRGMAPGCEFAYEAPERPQIRRAVTAIAASLLMLAAGASVWQWFTPSAYVDININPGVRMAVNPFGGVIRTVALNDDGHALLSGMSARLFASAADTAVQIIGRAADNGYVKDKGNVLITIADDDENRAESAEKSLFSASLGCLKNRNIDATVTMQKVSREALAVLGREGSPGGRAADAYLSKAWHADSNPLFIERTKAADAGRFVIIFSRSAVWTGNERVTVAGADGKEAAGTVVRRDGDEWLVACDGLADGQGYSVTVTKVENSGALSASLWIPAGGGVTDDNDPETQSGNGTDKHGRQTETAKPSAGGSPEPRATPSPENRGDDDDQTGDPEESDRTRTPKPHRSPEATHSTKPPAPWGDDDSDGDRVWPTHEPDDAQETDDGHGDRDDDDGRRDGDGTQQYD